MSVALQKKVIEETQYIISSPSLAMPVAESAVIPFAVNIPRKQKKRIEDVKITVHELIAALTNKEATDHFYKLTFNTEAQGPVFGPLHLDLATNAVAQAIFSNILASAGASAAYINAVIEAAAGLCSINATPEEKAYFFTTQIGSGSRYEGEGMVVEMNSWLAAKAEYINAETSFIADEWADELCDYLGAVGYSGIPAPDVTAFLAKLVKLTGSLDFLKPSRLVTVASIKAFLQQSGRVDTWALWNDEFVKSEPEFSDSCGNWYVVAAERAQYSA